MLPISRDAKSLEKETPSKLTIRRRNTLDSIIFNEMCDKADKDCENETNQEVGKDGNRKSKRSLKLLRGNERDLKLDMEAAFNYAEKSDHYQVSTPNHMKVQNQGSSKTRSAVVQFELVPCLSFKRELIERVYRSKLETDSDAYGQSPWM